MTDGYSVTFTPLAADESRRIAANLYRQWKLIRYGNLDEAINELRGWIVAPLVIDPFSTSSRDLGAPETRYLRVDRGFYLGNYHIAYVIRSDQKRCIVVLVQANSQFPRDFISKAIGRAEALNPSR